RGAQPGRPWDDVQGLAAVPPVIGEVAAERANLTLKKIARSTWKYDSLHTTGPAPGTCGATFVNDITNANAPAVARHTLWQLVRYMLGLGTWASADRWPWWATCTATWSRGANGSRKATT